MFDRYVLNKLRAWSESETRKPLILRGARQVGKTTVVNRFAEEFTTYIKLNLEDSVSLAIFEESKGIEEVVSKLFIFSGKSRNDARTLIFIDEIQNSPKAVALLRYFYEEYPQYYVIAAGSLLETLISKRISFPVGRVQYMLMRPCCFLEFLGATGKMELKAVIENCALPEGLNDFTMQFFNKFTLVGGMPEVVARYALNEDVIALNEVYNDLITSYREDVEKYAQTHTMTNVIRFILMRGWSFAGQQITLGNFGESAYKAREVGEAFRTLERTHTLELLYPITGFSLPIIPELKRKPKLIWLDTGLVNYMANIQKEIAFASDLSDAWRGKVAEQIVAQELLAQDTNALTQRTFWVRNSNDSSAEVDFVFLFDGLVVPVEVKSGINSHLRSLHSFMDNAPHDIAVRVWSKPFSVDRVKTVKGKHFRLFNVPFYYVGVLENLLKKYEPNTRNDV